MRFWVDYLAVARRQSHLVQSQLLQPRDRDHESFQYIRYLRVELSWSDTL